MQSLRELKGVHDGLQLSVEIIECRLGEWSASSWDELKVEIKKMSSQLFHMGAGLQLIQTIPEVESALAAQRARPEPD